VSFDLTEQIDCTEDDSRRFFLSICRLHPHFTSELSSTVRLAVLTGAVSSQEGYYHID
jgi:hypothetical protein